MRTFYDCIRCSLKAIVPNKANFALLLIIPILYLPLIFMLWNHQSWISNPFDVVRLSQVFAGWWGFIIALSVIGRISAHLSSLRDGTYLEGFSKTYPSKKWYILGAVCSEFIILLCVMFFIGGVTTLLFPINFAQGVIAPLLVALVTFIPVSCIGFACATIFHKKNTIFVYGNMLIMVLFYLSSLQLQPSDGVVKFLLLLNPVEFIFESAITILSGVFHVQHHLAYSGESLLFVAMIYILIGGLCIMKIKVNPLYFKKREVNV